MGRISHTATITKAVETIAVRQHGVVTRAQLRSAGLSEDQVDAWARGGRIRRITRGVYAVGHLPTNPIDQGKGVIPQRIDDCDRSEKEQQMERSDHGNARLRPVV